MPPKKSLNQHKKQIMTASRQVKKTLKNKKVQAAAKKLGVRKQLNQLAAAHSKVHRIVSSKKASKKFVKRVGRKIRRKLKSRY